MVEYFSGLLDSRAASLAGVAEQAVQTASKDMRKSSKWESGPPRLRLLLVCWWCLSDHGSQVLHWLGIRVLLLPCNLGGLWGSKSFGLEGQCTWRGTLCSLTAAWGLAVPGLGPVHCSQG